MIIYKSMASIHSYREYIKDKMRRARDNSLSKAKVSTINKKYLGKKSHEKLNKNSS